MFHNYAIQVFNEHQMAKLKRSEAFTVEREREIQQASAPFLIFFLPDLLSQLSLTNYLYILKYFLQVVESVNELAQIMKDLSVLVIDQVEIHLALVTSYKLFQSLNAVHSPNRAPLLIGQTTTSRMLQLLSKNASNNYKRSFVFVHY